MASGSISLSSSKAWEGRISWNSSPSIAGNYSDVYVYAGMWKTDGYLTSSNSPTNGTITINGTSYSLIKYQEFRDEVCIYEDTIRIYHNGDGSKSISISLTCNGQSGTSLSGYTLTGSGTAILDTIARASTLDASNGTLGTSQSLGINAASGIFSHTITYSCGGSSGTIAEKTSATSVNWTPPLALAKENTTGTSVQITLKITTYSGGTSVGEKSTTITCSIPASVKPSCTIAVTDPTGFLDTYGDYIKGQSKFSVVVTPTTSYGSPIASYSVTANGQKYTSANFETDVLKESGQLTISATVKDKRGRSGTTEIAVDVIDCPKPSISKLSVNRCDVDGSENINGEYIKVTFSAAVTNLDGQNTAEYTIGYIKANDSEYTEITLGELTNVFTVTDAEYIFEADTGSSYKIDLYVQDNFTTVRRTTSASTAFVIMHFKADGTGMGIGKISELSNLLDIGMAVRFYGGILQNALPPETDLNDIKTPNTYTGASLTSNNYVNCPATYGSFTLAVEGSGEDENVKQTYYLCSKYLPEKYVRYYYEGEWGPWLRENTGECILYENDDGSNGTIDLAIELSRFKYIEIFYTDNNGKVGGYTKVYQPDGKTICLQISEANGTAYSRQTMYTASGATITPQKSVAGYYTVNSSGSVSAYTNTNLIKIVRVIGLA